MADCENKLPQEGTGLSEAGESLGASASSPSYSGGGNNRSVCSTGSSRKGKAKKDLFARPQTPISVCEGEDSDCSIMSVSSQASTTSDPSRAGRKRTRKEKNEGGSDTEGTKRAMFLRSRAAEEEDEVFNPSVLPVNTRTKAKLASTDQLEEEMRALPTAELEACMGLALQTIEKIADKSKNLRGDFVKGLRMSVRKAEAIMRVATQRSLADANVERLERENAELRSQLADLSTKVEKLTEAVSQQGSQGKAADKAASPPATSGTEWEERLMERMAALVDRRLAAAGRAQPSCFPARTTDPTVPDPKRPTSKGKHPTPASSLPPEPPRSSETQVPTAPASSWATVAGRKAKRPKEKAPQPVNPDPKTGTKAGQKPGPKASQKAGPKAGQKAGHKAMPKPSRLPTTAAITVTVPEGSDVTYEAVMKAAKARVKLSDVGVDMVRTKRAITGGLILEVSGPDCISKADALAERMRVALADLGVRVARPVKTGELRLKDLDDSVTPQEVQTAVAESGGCSVCDVRVGDIRRSPTALGTVWVRCPLASVRKLAAAGHVVVGWGSARVDYLTTRPLQCFRCLEHGHVRAMCTSTVDRSTLCYACGEPDHRASQCTRPPRCPLCSSAGSKGDHRMGSKKCTPPKGKRTPVPPTPAPGDKAAPTKGAAKSGQKDPPPQEDMDAS